MKIGILGRRGSWYVTALQTALARHAINAPCFPVTRLTARLAATPRVAVSGDPLDSYDILLIHGIPGGIWNRSSIVWMPCIGWKMRASE